jgi:2'-5' RNA ligase
VRSTLPRIESITIRSPEGATELPTYSQESPSETWRVFVAIELPPNIRARIAEYIECLRSTIPEARASWSREINLHLTLKFLGDIPIAIVEKLSTAASIAASEVEPFDLIVGRCGAFPPRGQPRVLWIGIDDPSGELAKLHRALEDECDTAGFAREERPFHPHLTLARLRKPQGSRQLAKLHGELGFPNQQVSVSEMVLFRSELLSEGSRHTAISRHRFG